MKRAKFASCSALREPGNEVTILNTVFTVRTGRDLVTSPDKKNTRIQRPHDSGFKVYLKISILESGLKKLRIRTPDSPDTCGRESYPERKSYGFKNIAILVDVALVSLLILRRSFQWSCRDFLAPVKS